MNRAEIEQVTASVMATHTCHTAILYGSRARGDATAESDIDLLLVREEGPAIRDARLVDGSYLDAFVYPESALVTLEPGMLRLLGGVVLRERDGFGTELMRRVRELDERGPTPMPADERQALRVWSQKMLDRFRSRHDVEIEYRRMFLVVRALEDYFGLRNAWYRGEKEAFAWLREHDAPVHALFERAARAAPSDEALTELVRAVYGPGPLWDRSMGAET
jgi:uncharacterized protein